MLPTGNAGHAISSAGKVAYHGTAMRVTGDDCSEVRGKHPNSRCCCVNTRFLCSQSFSTFFIFIFLDYKLKQQAINVRLDAAQVRLDAMDARQVICRDSVRSRPNRCACNWQKCEEEGPNLCAEHLKAEAEALKGNIETIQTAKNALDNNRPTSHCAQMLEWLLALGEMREQARH